MWFVFNTQQKYFLLRCNQIESIKVGREFSLGRSEKMAKHVLSTNLSAKKLKKAFFQCLLYAPI